MAANAPYYQMRSGQFTAAPNSANTMSSNFASEDDKYELPAAVVASPHDNLHSPLYPEHATLQISEEPSLNTNEENHNLADLLEAATTAAGQTSQAMGPAKATTAYEPVHNTGKRKRMSSPLPGDATMSPSTEESSIAKRRRIDVPTDPLLQHNARGNAESTSALPSTELPLNDTRTAGVHSAAAIFRRASEKTPRKYTRPPMSKLFMSLQLSPESFLQLQAQAKAYMLDSSQPERQSCVGNRGRGDSDMVKLRLFNCVRDFLSSGVGEQYFGEHVQKPGEREAMEAARALGEDKIPNHSERLIWPKDGNKIISLVTPLMRRMVTNERQRMYAIETRKGGAKKKEKDDSVEANLSTSGYSTVNDVQVQQSPPAVDPTLSQHHLSQSPSPSIVGFVAKDPSVDASATQSVSEDLRDASNLPLPNQASVKPHLSSINIFVVLADHVSEAKRIPGPKLSEKRLSPTSKSGTNSHMVHPWDDFVRDVIELLEAVTIRYPEVRKHLVPIPYHASCDRAAIPSADSMREDLRGLAVAATALQKKQDDSTRSDTAHHPSQNIVGISSAMTQNSSPINSPNQMHAILPTEHIASDAEKSEERMLPRYSIRTLGENGWESIDNAEQWSKVLMQRACDVWADGTLNVIVELLDIPVTCGAGESA